MKQCFERRNIQHVLKPGIRSSSGEHKGSPRPVGTKVPEYGRKLFSSSRDLQTQCSIEVRNQFQLLEDGECRDPSYRCHEFIAANEIATKKHVPRREESRKPLRSRNTAIARARERPEEVQATETSEYDGNIMDNRPAVFSKRNRAGSRKWAVW